MSVVAIGSKFGLQKIRHLARRVADTAARGKVIRVTGSRLLVTRRRMLVANRRDVNVAQGKVSRRASA